MVLYAVSWPAVLLGQTKLAAQVRPYRTIGDIQAGSAGQQVARFGTSTTKPNSGVGRFLGYEALRTGIRWGTAIGSAVLGYKYLVESGLIERGAAQFGKGYGGALPMAYYEGQEEAMPQLKALESQTYKEQAPVYMEVEKEKIWSEAEERAKAYQHFQPYYQTVPETTKATTKMPYTVRINEV